MISLRPLLAAFLFAGLTTPAFADGAMIVLDASASMGGKLGRDRKMDLAADALVEVLADFPSEVRLGLTVFGSRDKKSCSDVEMPVRPQKDAADLVGAAAAGLRPRGKAPIAVAVDRAAQAINYRKERATLVVLVDQVESCDADPCVLAGALKRDGKDLTIHVLGLGLSDEDAAAVACLADKTGGTFLNAKDGTDLSGGLAKALASVKAPPADLPAASIEAPATVTQAEVFDVTYTGPKTKGDRIQIVWPGLPPGSEIRSVLVSKDGKARKLRAPAEAGTYEIRYFHPVIEAVLATRMLEVKTQPVTVTASAAVDAGANVRVAWTGPAAAFDDIRIVPKDAAPGANLVSARIGKDGRAVTLEAPLEPGDYEVRYHSAAEDAVSASAPLRVGPPSASVAADGPVKAGQRFTVRWQGPAARFDDVVVARADMAAGDHVTTARVRPGHGTIAIAAPAEPGAYELRYVASGGKAIFARAPLTVE